MKKLRKKRKQKKDFLKSRLRRKGKFKKQKSGQGVGSWKEQKNKEIEDFAITVRQEYGFTRFIEIINEELQNLKSYTNDAALLQEQKYFSFKEDIISLSKEIAERMLIKESLKTFAVLKAIEDTRNRGVEIKNYYG